MYATSSEVLISGEFYLPLPDGVLKMRKNITHPVFVGDYGQAPVSPETLQAYGTTFLEKPGRTWRRSKTNRQAVERMERDLTAVQRYLWLRQEETKRL